MLKKDKLLIPLSVLLCCAVMAVVDGVIRPHYFVKSAIKLCLFLLVPLLFAKQRKVSALAVLRPDKRAILTGLSLGLGTFVLILGGYFLLRPYLDLSAIPEALMENGGITKEIFPFVALYIALCNSLLEEFFFRGFAYITLKKETSPRFAMIFSATAFAAYHMAIMDGWLSPLLFALAIIALFGCGVFFNLLNIRRERIFASWLTHLFANLAINTIGMILLWS